MPGRRAGRRIDSSAAGLPSSAPGRRRWLSDIRDLLWPGAGAGSRSELIGQSAQTTLLNIGAVLFAFITSLALSHLLGRRGYGIYVYALAWPSLLSVAALLGYSQLLVRNIAIYMARREWGLVRGIIRRSERVVVASATVLALVAAGLGWVFAGRGEPQTRQSFFLALLLVPGCALISQREAVLRGFRRVALGRVSETIVEPALLLVLVCLLAAVLGRDVSAPAVVAATVVAAVGGVAVATALVARTTPSQVRSAEAYADRTAWARSARSLFAINGLQIVNVQMGVILLGALKTVDSTAVFSVALRCSGLVSFLQTAVAIPLVPAFARLNAAGSRAQVQRLASKANVGVVILSIPVALVLVLFGGPILGLFGEQFRTGRTALTILIVGELTNVGSGFVGILLISAGHERAMFNAFALLTLLKIGVSAALIQVAGLEGAAIAQAVGIAAQSLIFGLLVWRRLGIYGPGIGSSRFLREADGSP